MQRPTVGSLGVAFSYKRGSPVKGEWFESASLTRQLQPAAAKDLPTNPRRKIKVLNLVTTAQQKYGAFPRRARN
jgi:hypothetical protein